MKRLFLTLTMICSLLLPSITKADNVDAGAFVIRLGDKVIASLASNRSIENTKQTLADIMQTSFDMQGISAFAMGRHWNSATPAQQEEFQKLFFNYVLNQYSRTFSKYSGQNFKLKGSPISSGSTTIVSTEIVSPSGSQPVRVDWHLKGDAGNYKIFDVMVEGVSQAMTQREEVSSVIQQNSGSVDALLETLRKRAN